MKIPAITIRQANIEDAETLVLFNQLMATETESKTLDVPTLTAGVKTLINNDQLGFYLLAQSNNSTIASLMVTSEWSDWRNGLFWWIQSVYVMPQWRKQSVYRRLYEHVKMLAKDRSDICGYRLYVEKNNKNAQQVYKNVGMAPTYYQVFEELI